MDHILGPMDFVRDGRVKRLVVMEEEGRRLQTNSVQWRVDHRPVVSSMDVGLDYQGVPLDKREEWINLGENI